MEITSLSGPDNLLLTGPEAKIENWTVGRLLTALVSRANPDGSYTLQLGGQRVQVKSDLPLQAGASLRLEVVETGAQTVLRRLPETVTPSTVNQLLRESLPRQASATPLLSNLSHLSGATGNQQSPVPAAVSQLAQQIAQALTSQDALKQPQTLKQALMDSGVFLEARLAAAIEGRPELSLARDFKAGLLKLAQLLAQHLPATTTPPHQSTTSRSSVNLPASRSMEMAPPPMRQAPPATLPPTPASLALLDSPELALHELSHQVDAALARMQISQLSSLPSGDGTGQFWLLELPLRAADHVDSFQLRIQMQDEQSSTPELTSGWSVMLSFNLEGLGPMYARLVMTANSLSASLWAEQEQTVELLQEYRGLLQQQFSSAGLGDSEIAILSGRPADNTDTQTAPGLIRETV